jgi:hypothetical protein
MKHEFSWITPEYSAQVIVWVEGECEVEFLTSYGDEGIRPNNFEHTVVEYVLDWYNSNDWHQFKTFTVKDYILGE